MSDIDIYHTDQDRYEFNNAYKEAFKKAGFIASGINPESGLVEILELRKHRWFLGAQFHPELKSTVENPHPLFVAFVQAALERRNGENN